MNFLISTRAEVIKTRRSASFWLSLAGSFLIPLLFILVYTIEPQRNIEKLRTTPWELHFLEGWEAFSAFLLPMFVILICSLIPQIEFKNNTWKQVFASPQSIGNIFFAKYLAIILMILFLFLMFNIFMILAGVVSNLFYSNYSFLRSSIDWGGLLKVNFKTFVALLGIVSIQYWLGLRFRNFIVPIAIGLGLLIVSMMTMAAQWKHVDKLPHAFPLLTYTTSQTQSHTELAGPLLKNHELNSIGYFACISLLAFLDMRFRKERG